MKFAVQHEISYLYSKPVFLEPHTIRLRPRSDPSQRELTYELGISPTPAQLEHALDAEGNSVSYVWFNGLIEGFTVRTRLEAETLRPNPFGYLLTDSSHGSLPITYSSEELIHPALLRCFASGDADVQALTQRALDDSGGKTIDFLTSLTTIIFESAEVIVREDGDPYPADYTARTMLGACRDLVVLFNECCRSQGIAARFVSGYHEGDPDIARNDLHAWSEVYLPGGGWRGFDPTHGLAVGEGHVTLAAAANPPEAAAVEGSFRGTGATAKMTTNITLQTT